MNICNFIKTSTAGNKTLFLLGKDTYLQKKRILNIVLRKKNIEAEQIGFIWKENKQTVLNMAGKELCGGAILATPVLRKITSKKQDVFTIGNVLKSSIYKTSFNKFYNQSELPLKILKNKKELEKNKRYLVELDGISYVINKGNYKKKDLTGFKEIEKKYNLYDSPCLGIVEIFGNKMVPTIWIKGVKTIFAEKGCTTGTISTQIAFPNFSGQWIQPSGLKIKANILKNKIIIASEVEKLSEGKIFLNEN